MSGLDQTPAPTQDQPTQPTQDQGGTQQDQQQKSPGLLNISPATESAIGLIFAITLCLCIGGTWFVLCARVWQDGNAPLTLQISQLMLNTVPYMIAALVGGLLGRNVLTAVLSAIQARLTGATAPGGGGN